MKLNLSHIIIYIVAFGGSLLVAYEGFMKSGQALTLPAVVGVVLAGVGTAAAILAKTPLAADDMKGVMQAIADILQQLAVSNPPVSKILHATDAVPGAVKCASCQTPTVIVCDKCLDKQDTPSTTNTIMTAIAAAKKDEVTP